MNKKIKVLYFVDRMLRGGIQTFVIENIKNMDRTDIQIDFLLLDDGNHYDAEEELKELGCNIYILKDMWIRKVIDYIKYSKMLDNFFKEHNDYRVIHLHSTSKNYLVLKKAKKYGIPVRIAHSHSIDFQTNNILKKLAGDIFKCPLKRYATDFFACSESAGIWLFGKKIIKNKKFKIIHNAVNIEQFKFNEKKRIELRNKLDISEDCTVIGNVGRFTKLKNHDFLIDVFYEYHKIHQNSLLLLLGTGAEEENIKNKVKSLGLEKFVIFEGFINIVSDYMNVMDLFLFPSKFEGLGLVLVEAQTNGLKCYTSKYVVPEEANVSKRTTYISLEKSPKEWMEIIDSLDNRRIEKIDAIKKLGYDIKDTSTFLHDFYIKGEYNE